MAVVYERFKANLMNKLVNLGSGGDVIKVALMDNLHTETAGNNTWSQVSANEISGTGYTAGGATLASQTVTQGASATFDGADTAWTTASFTAYYAVLYDDTLVGKDLICSFDFGSAQTVSNDTFTLQWSGTGIITLG